ncbi:MAG: TIGR02449 family protein [Thiohalomonadaceae bacterium]|jgi:cell division protein ZapB
MKEVLDITLLERRVDELIHTINRLRDENVLLCEQHAALLTERNQLLEKTEQARTRVEAMIHRIKIMEQG